MTCDICHKKGATVHLTEIINDKVTKLHLCEHCAREKGEEMEGHFGLSDLLAGLTDLGIKAEPQIISKTKCPKCGFTLHDLRKIGRLGCSTCYDAFKDQLAPLLKQIHGSDRHIGKIPVFPESARHRNRRQSRSDSRGVIAAIKLGLPVPTDAVEAALTFYRDITQLRTKRCSDAESISSSSS